MQKTGNEVNQGLNHNAFRAGPRFHDRYADHNALRLNESRFFGLYVLRNIAKSPIRRAALFARFMLAHCGSKYMLNYVILRTAHIFLLIRYHLDTVLIIMSQMVVVLSVEICR